MKTPRLVRIDTKHGAHFVSYVHRKPRQRFCAASFYAKDHTREDVEKWVRNNPKLVLQPEGGAK